MNSKSILFFIVLLISIFATSCKHDSATDNLPEVSFSTDVLPIFQTGCAISGCHDEATGESGETYTNYQNISSSVDPGNPESSKVYKAMTNYFEMMPPKTPLSVEERTKVRVWILQGAKNN